ncbi:hypothetical protein ABZ508_26625 [Streptomyces lavendulocolor]|uniref:Secreted protein n=1 Tax=Streptomyces lavendulocolor TaxID=67316 RepID=A0ABV2WC86_9ACTN
MIIPLVALIVSSAALLYVIRQGREARRYERQTWADLYLVAILNSRTRYYQRQTAASQARVRELQARRRR